MRAEDLLPAGMDQIKRNGVVIRKGSVGAFLANAKILCDHQAAPEQRAIAEHDLLATLPALRALGLFEVLSVRDEALRQWLASHLQDADTSQSTPL